MAPDRRPIYQPVDGRFVEGVDHRGVSRATARTDLVGDPVESPFATTCQEHPGASGEGPGHRTSDRAPSAIDHMRPCAPATCNPPSAPYEFFQCLLVFSVLSNHRPIGAGEP